MVRTGLLAALLCAAAHAQSAQTIAPYYPTPQTIVEKMLELGGLKAGEKMYDLGSGDGRIVIMAAQKFHAEAVGIEIERDLCKQSMERIRKLGLEKTAHIVEWRFAPAELQLGRSGHGVSDAGIHGCQGAASARPPIEERRAHGGARFRVPQLDSGEGRINIADDGEGRSHTIYLYRK